MKKLNWRIFWKDKNTNPKEYWGISDKWIETWQELSQQTRRDIKSTLIEVWNDAKTHNLPYMLRKKLEYIEKDIRKRVNDISIKKIRTTTGIAHDLCAKLDVFDKSFFAKYSSNESISKWWDLKFNSFKEFATMYMTWKVIQSDLHKRLGSQNLSKYEVDIITPLYAHYSKKNNQSIIIYPFVDMLHNAIDIENLEEHGEELDTVNEIHKIFEKIRYILYPLGITDTSPQNAFIQKQNDKIKITLFDTTSKIETDELYERL